VLSEKPTIARIVASKELRITDIAERERETEREGEGESPAKLHAPLNSPTRIGCVKRDDSFRISVALP